MLIKNRITEAVVDTTDFGKSRLQYNGSSGYADDNIKLMITDQ